MAAKPERRAGDDDLPHELWREILNRLPVKTILRCRSVCKSWYSLVSSPDFISVYSTKNLNNNGNRVLLRVCHKTTRVWSYRSHDESLMESCEHDDIPEPFRGKPLQNVGSCNGLICLSKYKRDATNFVTTITFLIWNPTIRKVVEVPSRTFCSRTQRLFNLGFGFDSKASDYKVLCASHYAEDDNASVFEIFDLRKGVWRTIRPRISSCDVELAHYPECYLDGVVHWAGHRDRDDDDESYDRILLSFDMRDELFGEIRLPDCIGFIHVDDEETYQMRTRCMTFGGLIHLIMWKTDERLNVDMTRECSVWAMKEYGVTESWTKLFNIDQQSARLRPLDPFCLWKKGEILIVRRRCTLSFSWYQELLSYTPESGKCKSAFLITEQSVRDVILFEESLVLM